MLPLWAKIITLVGALGAFVVGKYYFHLKDDGFVEEIAEEVIEEQVGLDVDLSPQTLEVIQKY